MYRVSAPILAGVLFLIGALCQCGGTSPILKELGDGCMLESGATCDELGDCRGQDCSKWTTKCTSNNEKKVGREGVTVYDCDTTAADPNGCDFDDESVATCYTVYRPCSEPNCTSCVADHVGSFTRCSPIEE